MSTPLSLKIGHFLYRYMYPAYRIIYPIFKKMQDADEIDWLKRNIKPGDVILDIGANIGFYSRILSRYTGPDGIVHSFEPDRENFRHLKDHLGGVSNIVLNNMAVSDEQGEISIYRSKELNVDHRTYPVGDYESVDKIRAISIDDYVGGRFKVNLIKMDIQGYEVAALRGMKNTIKANPSVRLLLEFWPHGLQAAGSSVSEFYRVLTDMGLRIRFLEKGKLYDFDAGRISEYETWERGQYRNILVTF